MKKQLFFVAAISALLNSVSLLAENITIACSSFGDTSVWEYVSNPGQYQEEKSHWGVLRELNEHTAENNDSFWGIGGLAKNSEGKSYYHTLSFLPQQLVGVTNVLLEFSYFAEGLDSGENIQWCLFCDTTNLFGSLTRSQLDTSNEWGIETQGDAITNRLVTDHVLTGHLICRLSPNRLAIPDCTRTMGMLSTGFSFRIHFRHIHKSPQKHNENTNKYVFHVIHCFSAQKYYKYFTCANFCD